MRLLSSVLQKDDKPGAALAAARAKYDRIDKELAAIAAKDPGAKDKFMNRVAGQKLSELVDTVYDD